jgi:predicted small lipoprotein YifL
MNRFVLHSRRLLRLFLVLAATGSGIGCGQMGPLYQPPPDQTEPEEYNGAAAAAASTR